MRPLLTCPPQKLCKATRTGITLVEMLVALAVTLIMMAAVVTVFGLVGDSISSSRAVIEQSERLRSVRNRLQDDLAGITVTMDPPRKPENDEGYFEYVEGAQTDIPGARPSIMGDTDDVLCFTIRSSGEPFIGRDNAGTIQSQTAEVVWFVADSGTGAILDAATGQRALTLYRRVLLVNPSHSPFANQTAYDVSGRFVSGNYLANTLSDLTKRENRYGHNAAAGFPFPLVTLAGFNLASGRLGEDVILTNVVAFDVQVFDQGVSLKHVGTDQTPLVPSDAGYSSPSAVDFPTPIRGGYVDLGYNTSLAPATQFSGAPHTKSGLSTTRPYIYDTWSEHYEQNGADDDDGGSGPVDEGTNGLDDNNDGVVDDQDEMETQPPYNVKLRGIQIKIRVYEPDSRQVREVTVVQDFLTD